MLGEYLDRRGATLAKKDSSLFIGIFAAILFAGGVAAAVLIGVGEYGVFRTKAAVSDGKTDADRALAKKYALQALRPHGIRSLSRECKAIYDDGQWLIEGKAINRDNGISDVMVMFNVATVGDTTHWRLAYGRVDDGEYFTGR